ncbi:ClpXP protease specificity-enhancing factor SspB [Nannocystis pusilla]|uniref:ClpXP protease specificity-enhancing factor SspB n=1 Tax=Nannocystis pusilla TaxID=889268 RepID=A0A9X3ERA7_9BACT|nr:ClpXP protease specificity-enhancing factor SspB [Nannocystis pusilla]MCY1008738.1 ClpXP protease specificity-enhancing factor SspB [Nannocystis pusilla]
MVHPVQSVIESLYAAGRCPRLHVDATHASVTVPDFIRQQWRERLIIDLDASYPLDLVFGETGLAADLSFGGHVTRCSFPWESIYIVTDRSTGRGIVLDRHVPESVKRQAAGQQPAPAFDNAITKVEPPVEAKPELRRVEAEPAEAEAEAEPAEAEAAPPAAAATPSDDQAKKRRAAFRVIDGGG